MNTQAADGFADFAPVQDGPVFVKSRRSFSVEAIAQSVRNFATLSEALRMLGAAVLVASMSVFLLQGWSEGNDVNRYLLLLTQTGLLAAAGFAMSHGLRETRGARIFFGLALVSIPANFVILSALVYSVLQWDAGLINYPDYALWQIDTLAGTGLTLGGAMLVLVPITLLCYAIMARRSARALSLHFVLLNTLLLLPIRGSLAAGSLALIGAIYALRVVAKLTSADRSLKTGEGKFALATLFIPIGIILFRSMYFYQVDSLMVAMVAMALFLSARQVSLFPDRTDRVALALESVSVPVAFVVAWSLTDALAPTIANALEGPLFATTYALLNVDILRRTENLKLSRLIAATISVITALSFTFSVADQPGAMTAIMSLAAAAFLLIAGLSVRNRTAILCGLFTLIGSIVFGAGAVLELIVTSSWIELAIFGACAITLGSVLDRHGVMIKLRLVKWFDSIGEKRERMALEE